MRYLVTGGTGFLGSFIVEKLVKERNVDPEDIVIPRHDDCDLRIWENCVDIINDIDIVIHAAGRGGGIGFNQKYPATLFYDNIIMNTFMMEAARKKCVKKFISVGTVCSYPKYTPTPFKEKNLWDGYPEETNASYGLSKKMMIVQSKAYRQQYDFNSVNLLMINLYGPRDNFNLEHAHVIPALIRKMIYARNKKEKSVTAWGTGNSSREFIYVEDAAEGVILATERYNKSDPVNLGNGREIRIKELVTLIAELVGYKGNIIWDTSKPDGQPRRCLDISKAKKEFGFEAKIDFTEGVEKNNQMV